MQIQKSQRRGQITVNWLKAFHYFSFGHYYNPLQINYGPLHALSEYELEKVQEFEKVTLKNKKVYTIVTNGKLRQTNDLEERFEIKKGQLLALSCQGNEGLTFFNQNQNDEEIAKFIQIYVHTSSEQQQQSNMEIIDFEKQFSQEKINQIIQISSENDSDARIQMGIVYEQQQQTLINIKPKNDKNGNYIVILEGQVQLKSLKSGQTHYLIKGDAFLSEQGEQFEINYIQVEDESQKIIEEFGINIPLSEKEEKEKLIKEKNQEQVVEEKFSKILAVEVNLSNHEQYIQY